MAIPNGAIIKFSGGPEVYLVDNGKLRHITKPINVGTNGGSNSSVFNFMVELGDDYKNQFDKDPGAPISSDIEFDPVKPGWEGNFKEDTSGTDNSSTTTEKATLYKLNSDGSVAKKIVDVGSDRASDLQSDGWVLTEKEAKASGSSSSDSNNDSGSSNTNTTTNNTNDTNNTNNDSDKSIYNNYKVVDDNGEVVGRLAYGGTQDFHDKMLAPFMEDGFDVQKISKAEYSELKNQKIPGLRYYKKQDIIGYASGDGPVPVYASGDPGDAGSPDATNTDPNAGEDTGGAQPLGYAEDTTKYNFLLDGDKALVKFTNEPTPSDGFDDRNTVWLYNKAEGTYTPFASQEAFEAYYGENAEAAYGRLQTLDTSVLGNDAWNGKFATRASGIQADGKQPSSISYINSGTDTDNSESATYGAPKYDKESMGTAISVVGAALTPALQKEDISQEVWDANIGNSDQLQKYISAIMYGGYSITDIYKDLKAKELSKQGNKSYDNFIAFSTEMKADEWKATQEGQLSANDPNLIAPAGILNVDWDMLDNPIFQLPNEVFSTLVPPIDITSDEFKEEAQEIQAAYYDILMQQSEAQTEQAQAIAQNNWDMFKDSLEKKYGIQLSDSANEAWTQLEKMFSGYSERGLGQSGMLNEVMDSHLADVRRSDQLLREANIDEKELEHRNYLLTSGTPQEIRDFINNNPDKAKSYGMITSDEQREYWTTANLKEVYPNLTDEEIELIKGLVIDEYGNYRSELFQNQYANKYDLSRQKTAYQEQKLLEQKLLEQEKAYAPWSTSNPFSSYMPDYITDAYNKIAGDTSSSSPSTNPYGDTDSGTGSTSDWTFPEGTVRENLGEHPEDTMPSTPNQSLYIGATNWGNLQSQYTPAQLESATELIDGKRYWKEGANIGDPTTPSSGSDTGAASDAASNISSRITGGDSDWNDWKTTGAGAGKDWSNYVPVVGGQEGNFVNIQNPGGNTLYGIQRDQQKEEDAMKAGGIWNGNWDDFHRSVYGY